MKTFNKVYFYARIFKGAMFYDLMEERYIIRYVSIPFPINKNIELIIDYRK